MAICCGYNERYKTAAEFNITKKIETWKKNSVAVQVLRWSDASYMEDQDFWRLSLELSAMYMYTSDKSGLKFLKDWYVWQYKDGVFC
jgi:beta-galactosidase